MEGRTLDKFSYELGVMDCFCEMVAAGLKKLAMSHPCDTREERDGYEEAVKELCKKYHVCYYKEDDAFLTPLFPKEANQDKYNYLFFRTKEVLEQYQGLKEEQKQSQRQKSYTEEKARELARAFGRLLSYPEEGIERLLKKSFADC